MTETNAMRLKRWFLDMWNRRDLALLHELMAPDCTGEAEGGSIASRAEFVEKVYHAFLDAFPDIHFEVDAVVDHGEDAVIVWRARGTHRGNGLGIPASGRAVSFRGMSWTRWRGGQIVRGLDSWNQSGLFQALQTGEAQGSVQVL